MKHIQKRLLLFALASMSVGLSVDAQSAKELMDSLLTSGRQTQVAYRKVDSRDVLGGVSTVNVEELMQKNYHTSTLNHMQGFVGGWNGSQLWGLDDYLALVDGAPRSLDSVKPDEIESITFLKGAQAVVLYGSRAAKGAVLVTTKRGKIAPLTIDVRANTGWNVAKAYPEYLGSAEYMTLYNEALKNDGLSPKYTAEEIYFSSTGQNPYRYPNVDFYSSDFIQKAYNRSDVTAEIYAGSSRARFYANISYYNVGSPMNFGQGKHNRNERFSVRGNVDVELSKAVSAYVNSNVSFYDSKGTVGGSYWSLASTFRPNRIAPLIPLSMIDPNASAVWDLLKTSNNIVDGKYFLAGTQNDLTNVFADYYAAGKSSSTKRNLQFDAGVNINLEKLLKGLSFHVQYSMDYATSYSTKYDNKYATFIPVWGNFNGYDMIVDLTKSDTNDEKTGKQSISGSDSDRTISMNAHFDYSRMFGKAHQLDAMLLVSGFQQTFAGVYHRTCNANIGVQASYNYKHKYYAEFSGSAIHSARLAEGHRNAFSPSFTLGWNLAEEELLKGSVVDELMVSASGSILHTDLGIDYYMYKGGYDMDGSSWGWYDGGSLKTSRSLRGSNEGLTFLKRKELSVNVRTSLWKRMLTADLSFFVNSMEGGIISSSQFFPSYFNYSSTQNFLPYINYNNDRRMGFDFSLNYNTRFGDVDFSAGVCGTYYKTKATKRDDSGYENAYQYRQGKAINPIWGYECLGFFQDEDDIAASPSQTTLGGGVPKPGDLKYKDQNNDQIIDSKDQVALGQFSNPFTMGINLTAKYKNFTLFLLGTGNVGGQNLKKSSYYWISGEDKYSKVVRGRWTEETAATATYPRLTTGNGNNNFVNSDFWMYKSNRFDLAKMQLTYDFPASMLKGKLVKALSVYASGANLLTISKEREHFETNVGSAPQTRFYNFGVKATF